MSFLKKENYRADPPEGGHNQPGRRLFAVSLPEDVLRQILANAAGGPALDYDGPGAQICADTRILLPSSLAPAPSHTAPIPVGGDNGPPSAPHECRVVFTKPSLAPRSPEYVFRMRHSASKRSTHVYRNAPGTGAPTLQHLGPLLGRIIPLTNRPLASAPEPTPSIAGSGHHRMAPSQPSGALAERVISAIAAAVPLSRNDKLSPHVHEQRLRQLQASVAPGYEHFRLEELPCLSVSDLSKEVNAPITTIEAVLRDVAVCIQPRGSARSSALGGSSHASSYYQTPGQRGLLFTLPPERWLQLSPDTYEYTADQLRQCRQNQSRVSELLAALRRGHAPSQPPASRPSERSSAKAGDIRDARDTRADARDGRDRPGRTHSQGEPSGRSASPSARSVAMGTRPPVSIVGVASPPVLSGVSSESESSSAPVMLRRPRSAIRTETPPMAAVVPAASRPAEADHRPLSSPPYHTTPSMSAGSSASSSSSSLGLPSASPSGSSPGSFSPLAAGATTGGPGSDRNTPPMPDAMGRRSRLGLGDEHSAGSFSHPSPSSLAPVPAGAPSGPVPPCLLFQPPLPKDYHFVLPSVVSLEQGRAYHLFLVALLCRWRFLSCRSSARAAHFATLDPGTSSEVVAAIFARTQQCLIPSLSYFAPGMPGHLDGGPDHPGIPPGLLNEPPGADAEREADRRAHAPSGSPSREELAARAWLQHALHGDPGEQEGESGRALAAFFFGHETGPEAQRKIEIGPCPLAGSPFAPAICEAVAQHMALFAAGRDDPLVACARDNAVATALAMRLLEWRREHPTGRA
ncbi:hypothetical protein H696_04920 [Fonticula alba]|uniref:Uncharacterized protein n=1 Tax=Fonticula alba TaxID=691883 RepID=A0A058Z2W8_FONAL|nr:hypothetical protein H696_04920 [Fonticula alba]KCV68629.1 hypothetical protein H696_04920 [Fonticula alba]|eukprot:XP_009497061.1 hypothetical protein H696_04920 [Fonticula alba]